MFKEINLNNFFFFKYVPNFSRIINFALSYYYTYIRIIIQKNIFNKFLNNFLNLIVLTNNIFTNII